MVYPLYVLSCVQECDWKLFSHTFTHVIPYISFHYRTDTMWVCVTHCMDWSKTEQNSETATNLSILTTKEDMFPPQSGSHIIYHVKSFFHSSHTLANLLLYWSFCPNPTWTDASAPTSVLHLCCAVFWLAEERESPIMKSLSAFRGFFFSQSEFDKYYFCCGLVIFLPGQANFLPEPSCLDIWYSIFNVWHLIFDIQCSSFKMQTASFDIWALTFNFQTPFCNFTEGNSAICKLCSAICKLCSSVCRLHYAALEVQTAARNMQPLTFLSQLAGHIWKNGVWKLHVKDSMSHDAVCK